jgi:hypothetical protein
MDEIKKVLLAIRTVEEKFRIIQENSALHGAENGLTMDELQILDKLISLSGEASIAADAITKRCLS